MHWIITSREICDWLKSRQPTTLIIDTEITPEKEYNPITSSMALVAQTWINDTTFPTLAFFCGLHTNEAQSRQLASPMDMLNCLNSQLLRHLNTHSASIHLPSLESWEFREKSQNRISAALALFGTLIHQLPRDIGAITILIDSACRLHGAPHEVDNAIDGILEVVENAAITAKVMITDLLFSTGMRHKKATRLFVPSRVDGDRQGWDVDFLRSQTNRFTASFRTDGDGCRQ